MRWRETLGRRRCIDLRDDAETDQAEDDRVDRLAPGFINIGLAKAVTATAFRLANNAVMARPRMVDMSYVLRA